MRDLPSQFCRHCGGTGVELLPLAGQRLREVRLEYGISVKRMASALGVSQSTLCDWESGRRRVPTWVPQEWERICEQDGRHLPPQERVEARPEAAAEAPAELPLCQQVDDGPRQEPLVRSQPRTIFDALREQQEQKR